MFYDFSIILFIYKFFSHKWFFDFFYNSFIVKYFLNFCYFISFKLIDRGLIEIFGNLGLVNISSKLSLIFSKFHSGFIYHYIFLIILSLSFFILLYFFFNFFFISQFNFLLL